MDKIHWRDYHSRHKTGMSASLLAKYVYENYLLEFTRDFNPIGKDTESLQDSNNPSEIWQHKDEWLGRTVVVQYFEETCNANGGISLRFPVYLDYRTDL